MRISSSLLVGSLLFGGFCLNSFASNPEAEFDLPEAQVSGGVELPVWEEGASCESFDIRIWPEALIVWLERENLRDMIADPNTSEEERKALKVVLAHQRAWHAG
tara:strand:+ start:403 stop:714 length:312 start_codon:yes stop_codon:yes gene_type:complete